MLGPPEEAPRPRCMSMTAISAIGSYLRHVARHLPCALCSLCSRPPRKPITATADELIDQQERSLLLPTKDKDVGDNFGRRDKNCFPKAKGRGQTHLPRAKLFYLYQKLGLSSSTIGHLYGVSPSTVRRLMKTYDIPTKRSRVWMKEDCSIPL